MYTDVVVSVSGRTKIHFSIQHATVWVLVVQKINKYKLSSPSQMNISSDSVLR